MKPVDHVVRAGGAPELAELACKLAQLAAARIYGTSVAAIPGLATLAGLNVLLNTSAGLLSRLSTERLTTAAHLASAHRQLDDLAQGVRSEIEEIARLAHRQLDDLPQGVRSDFEEIVRLLDRDDDAREEIEALEARLGAARRPDRHDDVRGQDGVGAARGDVSDGLVPDIIVIPALEEELRCSAVNLSEWTEEEFLNSILWTGKPGPDLDRLQRRPATSRVPRVPNMVVVRCATCKRDVRAFRMGSGKVKARTHNHRGGKRCPGSNVEFELAAVPGLPCGQRGKPGKHGETTVKDGRTICLTCNHQLCRDCGWAMSLRCHYLVCRNCRRRKT